MDSCYSGSRRRSRHVPDACECDFDDLCENNFITRVKEKLRQYVKYIPGLVHFLLVLFCSCLFAKYCQSQSSDKIGSIEDCGSSSINGDSVSLIMADMEGRLRDEFNKSMLETIRKFLRIYDSDKTGMIDWAGEALGGSVVEVQDTESYIFESTNFLGLQCRKDSSDPWAVLRPSNMPGDCWAFVGQRGSIVIRLGAPLVVSHVTLEHIPKDMMPDGQVTSAPRKFSVWGLRSLRDTAPHRYGHYEYNATGDNIDYIQTFAVQQLNPFKYDMIQFDFLSNYGNKEFTCVYRVRVHGQTEDCE